MQHQKGTVEIWQEKITLPTYKVGEADKNPMFLEKRVYQGSSGRVYPCPVIDKIYDEKVDEVYNAVWLENDYLRVMILPELGGRIQRAYDKTNDYDFVYYNEVIKPALVGLTGPWISGGIEFNWPQHHRPTTYCPVDYLLCENDDGSKTVRVSETDQMYGTKGMASFTLYSDKAYIEIKGQLYNPTALPQTFLWWANPAVAVNDHTQSIFPPDVTAVMDHGKRDMSKFPIATGVYYKHDYGEGVDISRYKNIPVPTSYMAYHSDYNFVGGYDYGVQAGIVHIADHHVSPGKKQWTWGNGDFGKAWDRNLTDENGPYIELMTGMFTDNQPDFTWLKPFEEKQFVQYFMPYKKAGNVKNASTEVVLNLEIQNDIAWLCVYGTAVYENASIVLTQDDNKIYENTARISPMDVVTAQVKLANGLAQAQAHTLTLSVYDNTGRLMLQYTPAKEEIKELPQPAQALKQPQEISTNEQLYLAGLHLEQYRHATYLPDDYYQEALKRDAGDIRSNDAYGMLLLRRGLFAQSQTHFDTAIQRMTAMSPNPYNGEPYYHLGLSLLYQGNNDEAFDAFFKATWTSAEQEMSFYYLAAIATQKGSYAEALGYVTRSLYKNSRNLKARGLKALLLRLTGALTSAHTMLIENIEVDPFDFVSRFEQNGFEDATTLALMRNEPNTFLAAAACYAAWGQYDNAIATLGACTKDYPLLHYYTAYYQAQMQKSAQSDGCQAVNVAIAKAEAASPLYCFPNKLEDIAVLQFAIDNYPNSAKACYYLGNLWYDKRQYEAARTLWEQSVQQDATFPTAWRNLSLAYYNKEHDSQKARHALETAFSLDKTDARVFLELDQLFKKCNVPLEARLQRFDANQDTFEQRDDLWVEYITLLNLLGRHEEAYARIMSHKFHPWEGGEGKITAQYTLALVQLARAALAQGNATKAKELLTRALTLPENLGEGKLEGAKDNNIYYLLGCACEVLGETQQAQQAWQLATLGETEPAGMMYYNDQPADLILYQGLALQKLEKTQQAQGRFHKLVDYGEKHLFDTVEIDYFAVSLPDLALFDEDLTLRNQAHCQYLIALGSYGLGDKMRALSACCKTLAIDCAHIGAVQHSKLFAQ